MNLGWFVLQGNVGDDPIASHAVHLLDRRQARLDDCFAIDANDAWLCEPEGIQHDAVVSDRGRIRLLAVNTDLVEPVTGRHFDRRDIVNAGLDAGFHDVDVAD